MRISLIALLVGLFLASSAFAGNIALVSLGASAICGGTPGCNLSGTHPASNAIDGVLTTNWIAPSNTVDPYVLVDLGGLYTVDSVSIYGVGNTGNTIGFQVWVGGTNSSTEAFMLSNGTQITPGTFVQAGTSLSHPPGWTDTFSVSPASKIEFVLYEVTQSNNVDHPTWDNAATGEIIVDAPEPATLGMLGAGLLALVGFTRRSLR